MQANSWHHELWSFHLYFCIWKLWQGRKNIAKIWISLEWKKLFRWDKKHFWWFLKYYHLLEKIKIVDTLKLSKLSTFYPKNIDMFDSKVTHQCWSLFFSLHYCPTIFKQTEEFKFCKFDQNYRNIYFNSTEKLADIC